MKSRNCLVRHRSKLEVAYVWVQARPLRVASSLRSERGSERQRRGGEREREREREREKERERERERERKKERVCV
jgi:hypothetical protein